MKKQVTHKTCPPRSGCGNSFLATTDNFYQDDSTPTNLSLYCKKCKNGRTKAYNRKHPARERYLNAMLNKLKRPKYNSWIRMILVISLKKFDKVDEAAEYLGMRSEVFYLLAVRHKIPLPKEEDCVHEITKRTCHFCRRK